MNIRKKKLFEYIFTLVFLFIIFSYRVFKASAENFIWNEMSGQMLNRIKIIHFKNLKSFWRPSPPSPQEDLFISPSGTALRL